MNDSNSLCTVGMLSTLLDKTGQDYLGLISPFVLRSLPDKVGQEINLSNVQQNLREHYGFEDMPLDVISKILKRACKGESAYVNTQHKRYTVKKVYPREDFDRNYNDMRSMIQAVLNELREYLADTFGGQKPDKEKAQDMLFSLNPLIS